MEVINTLLSCEHAHTQAQDKSILLEENLRKGLEYFPEVLRGFEFPDLVISLVCENPKEHYLDGRTPKFGLAVYCGGRICEDWIPPVRADLDCSRGATIRGISFGKRLLLPTLKEAILSQNPGSRSSQTSGIQAMAMSPFL